MSTSMFARPRRVVAELCLLLAATTAAVLAMRSGIARGAPESPPVAAETARAAIRTPAHVVAPAPVAAPPTYKTISGTTTIRNSAGTAVVVDAPGTSVARDTSPPLFTMLHGMCGTGADICGFSAGLTSGRGFMVCPSGNDTCGDASDWRGDGGEKARFLADSVGSARDLLGLGLDRSRGDVLMGFSRGAFVARDVAYESKGEWVGLVLIGAATLPDADKLEAAGIRRVVLASGEFDGAKKTMVAAARKLCSNGLPARFVSLGPIYHALPTDLAERLGPSLDWVREEGSTIPGCGT